MRNILFLSILLAISVATFGQQPLQLQLKQRGEVVVTFDAKYLKQIPNVHSWSVDKVMNGKAYVYLNTKHYNKIIELNIPFVPEPIPSLITKVKMAHLPTEIVEWDSYPDYETYLTMMQQFAIDYPNICKLDTIGFSTENRLLLALKISDNVTEDETEPEFFYTATMHGDELTGYVLMLRLADYLLSNYETVEVKNLVDNMEIYINPLANPDGTFAAGNTTVNDATRENANYVDLNRNFPDPIYGNHPDNEDWQPETIAMMDFMKKHNFSLSMNFHGGAEVLNYPWDGTYTNHTDDDWFQLVCRSYADTVHTIDDTYMTDLNNGITNGADWYLIAGGRQDYVTHFLHGREITAELSTVKLVEADELPGFWDKNYRSLLQFINQALYGVNGFVTDADDNPINAKITVVGHDVDSSFVRTQPSGVFYRYLKAGTYNFKVQANGYITKTITNIVVNDFETTQLNVVLDEGTSIINTLTANFKIFPNPTNGYITIIGNAFNKNAIVNIYSLDGKNVWEQHGIKSDNSNKIDLSFLPKGVYIFSIQTNSGIGTQKLIVK